jgi:hypothetical protein
MLIDSTPSHHHIINNGPNLSNFNKASVIGTNSNLNKIQMNPKSFTQQDLTQLKVPLINHSVTSSISSHSSSSSTSSSSSSSSPGNSSSSSTPSSLIGTSSSHNIRNTNFENDQNYILKPDTKVIRINTKNYNLNRISAVKNINNSLNENKNGPQLITNHNGKIRVSSNGSIYSTNQSSNIQQSLSQTRNQNIITSIKDNSNTNATIENVFSNNVPNKALKVIVKTFSNNENDEKQLRDLKFASNQSVSMRNLKEINSSNEATNSNKLGTTCGVNYNNLQMALKAATQALEKSKIAASSVFSKNPVNSQSSINISNSSSHNNEKTNLIINNKNNVSQSQSNIPGLLSLPNDLNKSNQLFVTSSNSINNLKNPTLSCLISNNSLFQPYTKSLKDIQANTLSQSHLVEELKSKI